MQKVDIAMSTCSESFCGISTTFSSRPFDEISVDNFKLTDVLKDAGYRLNFYLSGDHRGWSYLKDYYGKQIDNYNDYLTLGTDSLDDAGLVKAFENAASSNESPNFFYFFLMATHQAGKRPAEFQRYLPSSFSKLAVLANELAGKERSGTTVNQRSMNIADIDIQAYINNYDNGILQTDEHIRRIFKALGDKGYLANSIVVVLGDHGDSLGEHNHFGHSRYLYQEDIGIPLLVFDSEKRRLANTEFATMIDIAPTILGRLGLPIPETWKGRSLDIKRGPSFTIHQTRRGDGLCFAIVDSAPSKLMKYIRCGNKPNQSELLFDVSADPEESRNLLESTGPNSANVYRDFLNNRVGKIEGRCSGPECQD